MILKEYYYPISPTKTQKAIICLPEEVQAWKDENQKLSTRVEELEAQVAALKKIAVEERSNFLYIYFHRSIVAKPLEPIECSNARLQDARRQLAEEHPEAFR